MQLCGPEVGGNERCGERGPGRLGSGELPAASSALPRPDIKQLKFYWGMLGDDIFIKYVMKKFPKLEDVSFEVKETNSVAFDNLSMDVLNPFFKYLSNIPRVNAEFLLKSDQVQPCLSHFMNNVKYMKQIEIVYDDSYVNNGNEAICVSYPVKGSTLDDYNTSVCRISIITSYTVSIDQELPHMKWWLNEFGDKIQLLNVTGIDKIQELYTSNIQGKEVLSESKQLSKSLYGDWINYALKRCTSMKGLTFSRAGIIDLDTEVNGKEEQLQNNSVQHLNIRDLLTSDTQGDGGQYFFNLLSRRLPSLNRIFLYDTVSFRYRENVIKIDMPFTSFDVIALGNDSMEPEDEAEDHIICLKLLTETSGVTFYYVIDFYEVIPVTEDQYAQLIYNRSLLAESSTSFSLSLEVRCKNLNSIRLVLNQGDMYHSYDKTYKLDLYKQGD